MNLTLTKEQLINGLQAVQNVVGSRTTLPILSNVLLRANGERLELTATDLDVTVVASVEAKVNRPGATTVPVKRLFGIVRELGASDLDMDVDEKNVCTIRSGSSFYRINGLAAEEFPAMPVFREEKKVVISQGTMKDMIKKTSFAMSGDESRYVLNGIFISLKDHKLTMVATDGRRLSLVDEEMDVPETSQGEFIVPSKAVNEMNRLMTDKGDVEILYTANQAMFSLKDEKGGPTVIITKLVDGSYPNYRQVIPAETKERVTLNREEFLHALRRAEIMTSDKQNSVKMSFSKNKLEITANSPEVGEAKETLAINYGGRDLAIAFNPKYVIDPLNALVNDDVYFEMIDELSPGIIKINGPFLYVVMPMRLT